MAFTAIAMAAIGAFGAAPTRGLVAYYPFDGDAKDASGNRNHGVMHGARPTADRKGRLNSAMLFGEGNYITVPSSPSLNSPKDQITIAAWVRIGEWYGGGWAPTICKGRNSGSVQYELNVQNTGRADLSITQIGARFENASCLRGAWHHIAVSYDGNMAKSYIDGNIAGLRHSPGRFSPVNEELLIGCDPPSVMEWLLGAMDELRIYNRALSDDEIKAVYEADPPTKTSALETKGWHVTTFDRTVRSIGDAETVAQGDMGMLVQGDYPVLAFSNCDSAYPEQQLAFPGKGGCLAMRATGTVHIPSAGMWTFGIDCDDGAKIRIKGKDFVDVIVAGCAKRQRFPINVPAAGDYELEVVFFDFMKGCIFTLSAAKGNWAAFDKSAFRLVGDPECEIKMVAPKGAKAAGGTRAVATTDAQDDTCPGCKGEKVKWGRCMKCGGMGYVVKSRPLDGGGTIKESFKCPACSTKSTPARGKGSGRARKVCPTCNGEGVLKR